MNRRDFLSLSAAVTLTAPLGAARLTAGTLPYRPGAVSEALLAGRTVLVDFHAPWCAACRQQARVLATLRAGNPGYAQAIDFITADWDQTRDTAVADVLGVGQRATLVALTPKGEVGRLNGATSVTEIKRLLDQALLASA